MTVTREWIIACKCPDCHVLMPYLSHFQEQHYPKDDKMPEMWQMTGGFTRGSQPFTCPKCGVTHETNVLTPQMIAVEPGTEVPLIRRGPQPLRHEASVATWQQIMDALPLKTHAPLIAKISDSIAPYASDESIVKIHLTMDETFAVNRVIEDITPATTG
jgi:hypothetical protein